MKKSPSCLVEQKLKKLAQPFILATSGVMEYITAYMFNLIQFDIQPSKIAILTKSRNPNNI